MDSTDYILRLVLRARDEMAKVLAKARGELRAFGNDARSVTGEVDKLNKSISSMNTRLGGLTKKLDEWRRTVRGARSETDELADSEKREATAVENLAKAKDILAKATAKASGAQRSFNVSLEKLGIAERGSREEALKNVEAREKQLKALRDLQTQQRERIKSLNDEIRLEKARRVSIANSGTDLTQLRKTINGENDLLDVINEKINSINESARATSRASSSNEQFSRSTKQAERDNEGFVKSITRTGGSISGLDNKLRGIAYLLVFAFAQQLITVLGGLGGALVSVAGSAAMAGAAIAGGLTGGIAQSIPIIGLLVGALARVKSIMDTVQAAQKLEQANFTKSGQASKQAADRADSLAAAQDRLKDAQENLTKVRQQAKRDLQDLILAEKSAELAARGAILSQAEAQEALRIAVQSGDVEGIAQAELDVLDRQIRAEESLTKAKRARQDVRVVGGKVENLDSVKSATRAVDDAAEAIQKAQRNVDTVTGSIDTAAQNLAYLMSQLSPAEQELYKSIQRIRNTYKTLWRSVTDIIIDSFTGAVDNVNRVMQMPDVIATAKRMSAAIGDSIGSLSDYFTSDKAVDQMQRIADAGTKNIPYVASLLQKFGQIFLNIAEAAQPAIELFLKFLNRLADDFLKTTDDRDGLIDFFVSGEKHLESWINLFISLIRLFSALTGAGGAKQGKTLIDEATAGIDGFTEKIKKSPAGVEKFFKGAAHIAREFIRVMVALAKELGSVFDPAGTSNFADVLIEVWIPAIGNVIRTIGKLIDKMSKLIQNDLFATFAKWAVGVFIFSQVISGTVGAVAYLASTISVLGKVIGHFLIPLARIPGVAALAYRAFWLLAGIGLWPILIVSGIILLLKKLGLLDNVARAFGGFFSEIWEQVQPSIQRLSVSLGKLFGKMGEGKGLFAVLKPIFKLIIDIGAVFLRVFGRTIGRVIGGVIDVLTGFIDFLTAVFSGDVRGALRAIGRMFTGLARIITAPFKSIGEAILKGITSGLGSIGDKIVGFIRSAVRKVKDFLGIKSPSSVFKDIGKAMVDGIVSAFTALPKLILGLLGDIVEKAVEIAGNAFGAAKKFLGFGGDDKKPVTRVKAKPIPDIFAGKNSKNDPGEAAKKQAELVSDAWKEMRNSARRGTDYIEDQYRDMRVNTTRTMNRLFRDHKELWADTERSGKRHATNLFKGVRGSFDALQNVVYEGMRYVASTTNKALKALDTETIKISLNAPKSADTQKAATGGVMGWVGNAGERGKDKVMALLGKGELVLNHWQQKALNNILPAQHTVQSALTQIGYHAGGPEQQGLAAGGSAGLRSGPIVGVPGFPGERAAKNILDEIAYFVKKFKGLRLNDAFGPDHSSPGHTRFGDAADFGGPDGVMDRAVQEMVRRGYKVLYDGRFGSTAWPGHGPTNVAGANAHIHVEFASKANKVLAQVADVARRIVSGPEGPTKKIAQSAINKVTKAANALIGSKQPTLGTEGAELMNIEDAGPVGKTLIRVWKKLNMPFKALLGAFETGIVESNMKNLRGGDADSAGWRQERASLYSDPTNVVNSAQRFFREWRQFDSPGLTAGEVSANVQRPAAQYRGRYQQVRSQALKLLQSLGVDIPDNINFSTGGFAGSFAQGGMIPGQRGKALGAIVHAGEWIINEFQQSRLSNMLGMNPQGLASVLGFHGSDKKGYAGGGVLKKEEEKLSIVGTTEQNKARIKQISKGFYDLSAFAMDDWGDLLKEVRRAFRAISQGAKKIKDKTKRAEARADAIDAIIKEGGILEQMETARNKFGNQLTRRLALLTFKFNKSTRTVTQQGNPISRAAAALVVAQKQIGKTIGQRDIVQDTLNRVNSELKRLQRGGVTKEESAQVRRLKGQQSRLNEQMEAIQDAYVAQVEAIFNAQEAVQQAVIDDINNDASRATGKLDRLRRIASAVGNNALVTAANQQQRGVLKDQADRIQKQIGAARKRGNNDLADQLADQVEDLRVQIFESIQAELREGVEAINKNAQRRLAGIDLGNRVLDAVGAVGLGAGVSALGGLSRANLFEARGNVLGTQQTELKAALRLAEALGNMGLVEELTDQLAELNVAVMENTAAYFSARLEDVNARASFANQINDLNKQVVELTAEIAGTTNTPALLTLAQQRMGTLQTQRTDLQGLLAEANATGNQKNINDLTVALLENQIAILQNTKSINELKGTIVSPQTFSSSAWQQFRQAIFNGNNGLQSQYAVPQSARGGYVASQVGSTMVPSPSGTRAGNVQYNDIDVNMTHPVEDVSGVEISNRVAWAMKTSTTEG